MSVASFPESLAFLGSQTGFAIQGMIAFAAGAASAWIVIHWHIDALERFPLWVLNWVTKLMGHSPGMVKLFLVICGFNSVAMFLYMCTGVWVVVPALVCFLTGMNLAVIFVRARPAALPELLPTGEQVVGSLPSHGALSLKVWPLLCGILVVVLELPAFWYAIGMGISLGHVVREHHSIAQIVLFRYQGSGVGAALAQRGAAFLHVIVPVLVVSALAEAYSVSEAGGMAGWVEREDDKESGSG